MHRGPLVLAPATAPGWTHIWDCGSEQLPIDDDVAATLVSLGIIEYTGDYRIYRPCKDWNSEDGKFWTLDRIKHDVLGMPREEPIMLSTDPRLVAS